MTVDEDGEYQDVSRLMISSKYRTRIVWKQRTNTMLSRRMPVPYSNSLWLQHTL